MDSQRLTRQLLIALVAGVLVGLALHQGQTTFGFIKPWITDGALLLIGKWFIALLMVAVVPLVFISLSRAVSVLDANSGLGRLSSMTMGLYLLTTAMAISTGLWLAVIFSPGAGLALAPAATGVVTNTAPSLMTMLVQLVPSNVVQSMAEGNMLQVIIFALLFGWSMAWYGRQQSVETLSRFLSEAEGVLLVFIQLALRLAPIGVFALMSRSIANLGMDLIIPLLGYFLVVVAALAVHALITYSTLLWLLTRLNPLTLWQDIKPVMTFAFSTSSSAATIPVTLAACDRMAIPRPISNFTIPLGATVNMDGTAIMQGVAAVFIAQVYQIPLSWFDYGLIVLTATLASIGTAAVPGAGLVMLTLVLTQVGLPVEGIALILAVDRLLDMLRTAVNVLGDIIVTKIVAHYVDVPTSAAQQS